MNKKTSLPRFPIKQYMQYTILYNIFPYTIPNTCMSKLNFVNLMSKQFIHASHLKSNNNNNNLGSCS